MTPEEQVAWKALSGMQPEFFDPGDTLEEKAVARIAAAIRTAVAEEREACSRLAMRPGEFGRHWDSTTASQIAAAIRARADVLKTS